MEQGFPAEVVAERGVKFKESGVEMLLPVGIAIVLAALASLNLAGISTGRILTWIFQSILLVVGGLVTAGQVFAVWQLESAFEKSGDTTLQAIDVKRFVASASAGERLFQELTVPRTAAISRDASLHDSSAGDVLEVIALYLRLAVTGCAAGGGASSHAAGAPRQRRLPPAA